MSEILNTSGEFYSAVFGEKSTGTYTWQKWELSVSEIEIKFLRNDESLNTNPSGKTSGNAITPLYNFEEGNSSGFLS